MFTVIGAHTIFWKNKWLNNLSLMMEFPTIFQIAHAKDSYITTTEEATVGTLTSEEITRLGTGKSAGPTN